MSEQLSQTKDRLLSVDTLRGLAMFLILSIDIGGAPVLPTFVKLWGESFADSASTQFSYGFTEGLRICFIAMPMFLFVVGLVIPFSMGRRLTQSLNLNNKKKIYPHIFKRALILFILGLIAGGHLLDLNFTEIPLYNNVLEYIAIGYLVCAMLVLNTSLKFQVYLTLVLLISYWLIFLFIPVPDWNGEIFSGEMNLAIYIDNIVLGPHHKPGSWQVLATISFISNMLIGVLIGHVVFSNKDKKNKIRFLLILGSAMLLVGSVWSLFFPVIRSLWTSTFVLVTCGLSTLILSVFFWIIDVKGYKNWALFFIVFGANSIAIYMMAHLFDFRLIGNIFVVGLCKFFTPNAQDFIQAITAMIIMWLILYCMYRKKIFIKI